MRPFLARFSEPVWSGHLPSWADFITDTPELKFSVHTALPLEAQTVITERVRSFEKFEEANDPHGEHDFGSFEYSGQTIFWKIDCYDMKLKWGSPDPADPSVTRRVLTILLAEEY
jgi:uncharacterized protein DUF3768